MGAGLHLHILSHQTSRGRTLHHLVTESWPPPHWPSREVMGLSVHFRPPQPSKCLTRAGLAQPAQKDSSRELGTPSQPPPAPQAPGHVQLEVRCRGITVGHQHRLLMAANPGLISGFAAIEQKRELGTCTKQEAATGSECFPRPGLAGVVPGPLHSYQDGVLPKARPCRGRPWPSPQLRGRSASRGPALQGSSLALPGAHSGGFSPSPDRSECD